MGCGEVVWVKGLGGKLPTFKRLLYILNSTMKSKSSVTREKGIFKLYDRIIYHSLISNFYLFVTFA